MPHDVVPAPADPAAALRELEPRLASLERRALAQALAPVAARLAAGEGGRETVDAVSGFCRALYDRARSGEALALAGATLEGAAAGADRVRERRAAMLCGLLAADAGDLVAAIEFHVRALRLANREGDAVVVGGVWNNIGMAMGISGHYELAARCYQRAIALLEVLPGPVQARYGALINMADALCEADEHVAGIGFAQRALADEAEAFRERDPHSALLLRRHFVRLLVGAGRVEDAQPYLAECLALAQRSGSPRSKVAAASARAMHELARGQADIALTRLEGALALARGLPAALRDTLACLVRAEEAAGHVDRALARLNELSEHVYRNAVERARSHIELAALAPPGPARVEVERERAAARLHERQAPPAAPPEWAVLERLARAAVLPRDATGLHGKRVGALVKALGLARGENPLAALEMGMAAELHDIGLASVPQGILRKKGALNESERALVRRHVEAGAEILRDDDHRRVMMARDIAAYHHARWDGGGYPEGVAGKRIPLAARACAVADAYDAMVCGLGARGPRSMRDALAELRREAGGQFDPELVDCFDGMVRAESRDLGLDLGAGASPGAFHELVEALQEDRGFV